MFPNLRRLAFGDRIFEMFPVSEIVLQHAVQSIAELRARISERLEQIDG
jgi:hypothetical protein